MRKRPSEKSPAWRLALPQGHEADAHDVIIGSNPFVLSADYADERRFSDGLEKAGANPEMDF